MYQDYLAENSTYGDDIFRRRYMISWRPSLVSLLLSLAQQALSSSLPTCPPSSVYHNSGLG
jgi:hypothetical protein